MFPSYLDHQELATGRRQGKNRQEDPVYFLNGLQIVGMSLLFTCSPNSSCPAFLRNSLGMTFTSACSPKGLETICGTLHVSFLFHLLFLVIMHKSGLSYHRSLTEGKSASAQLPKVCRNCLSLRSISAE